MTLADFKQMGKFKDDNIIFNDSLFNNSAEIIRELLQLQNQAKQLEYQATKETTQNLFKTNPGRILNNIMYVGGDEENLNNDISNKTFRPLTQIKQILASHLKDPTAGTAKEPMTSAQIAEILKGVNTKDLAKELINYLLFYWHFTFKQTINEVDIAAGTDLTKNYVAVPPNR
ncbi:MAG: hypothetical protein J6Z11_05575 [Candidatus Riflebacteria bacterium]|nr:hypothetical protein [Candidatus Riflebacteria bacterium]